MEVDECVCVYWLDRMRSNSELTKTDVTSDVWVAMFESMLLDADVYVVTRAGSDRDSVRAMTDRLTLMFNHCSGGDVWSVKLYDQHSAVHVVMCRDTVELLACEPRGGSASLAPERRGRSDTAELRFRFNERAFSLWAQLSETGCRMRDDVRGAVRVGKAHVPEGMALLGSWQQFGDLLAGRPLLEQDPAGRQVVVSVDDTESEASTMKVDMARSHESTSLLPDACCPVRVVLRTVGGSEDELEPARATVV